MVPLLQRAAVDDKVERIAERDERVDEHGGYLTRLDVDQIHVERVLDDAGFFYHSLRLSLDLMS